MHMLVVDQVGGLHKALLAEAALEGLLHLVGAAVAHEGILLFEAHLAEVALKGPLLAVGALMLPQV